MHMNYSLRVISHSTKNWSCSHFGNTMLLYSNKDKWKHSIIQLYNLTKLRKWQNKYTIQFSKVESPFTIYFGKSPLVHSPLKLPFKNQQENSIKKFQVFLTIKTICKLNFYRVESLHEVECTNPPPV